MGNFLASDGVASILNRLRRLFMLIMGSPPDLTAHHWKVLGLVIAASIFSRYDNAILQLALPRIQVDLGIGESQLSNILAWIKLGALPAILFLIAADRFGRRKLLIFTLTAYIILGIATALVTDIRTFVVIQFLARLFITVEHTLAVIIITEEFPAHARGWGIGTFVAISSVGYAGAAVLFAVIDWIPFGWRGMYLIGIIPLLFVVYLRRTLPETARFEEAKAARLAASYEATDRVNRPIIGKQIKAGIAPFVQVFRAYPQRFAIVALIAFIANLAAEVPYFYDPLYLQNVHNWQPWHLTVSTLAAGIFVLLFTPLVGRLSDRIGRKRTMTGFTVAVVMAVVLFYNSSNTLLLVAAWTITIIAIRGYDVSMTAINNEMFPTSYRSTAAGMQGALGTLGGVLGFALHTLLTVWLGSPWLAVSAMICLLLCVPILVMALPETSGRQLEEIAPER